MNAEEALKEAMSAQVDEVRATSTLGAAVRRRHRAHRTRLRTAGAALVTVAVAGAVPVYLSSTSGSETGPAAAVSVRSAVVVPDVTGRTLPEAEQTLKAAGLDSRDQGAPSNEIAQGSVISMSPPVGSEVEPGAMVTVTVSDGWRTKLSAELGDLGTGGRRFGGVEFRYLPEGFKWSHGYGKDGFGKTSYTTSWNETGDGSDPVGVQVTIFSGEVVESISKRMDGYGEQGADPIEVRGKEAYLESVFDIGRLAGADEIKPGERSTRVLTWLESPDLAIELRMNPDHPDVDTELKKIAEALRPTS